MDSILNQLLDNKLSYTQNDIEKGKKIIQELLKIQAHEIQNIYDLKHSTKIAFLFFKGKKYYFSIEELKKLLRLNEIGINLSNQIKDYKLNSHFCGHAGYIAQQLLQKTGNIEYAKKSFIYFQKALSKYKNNIAYQVKINNNIIYLGKNIISKYNTRKIPKKWIKIILVKINQQLEIYNEYPYLFNESNIKTLKTLKSKFSTIKELYKFK